VRPCAASFPNILGRADRDLNNVDEVLSRVDGTLGRVDGTLGDVSGTLSTVDERLEDVGTALTEVNGTLGEVKGLLAELEGEIALVKQLPEIAQQVREIHADRVLVRDLGHRLREPPERGRDEAAGVVGRVPARVAPQASNTSRRMEIDHTIPYAEGGPSGIGNYGPMTRRHHRIKTHDHWDVRQPDRGSTSGATPTAPTTSSTTPEPADSTPPDRTLTG
jgi:hypothetical protein